MHGLLAAGWTVAQQLVHRNDCMLSCNQALCSELSRIVTPKMASMYANVWPSR
jgi:hypothetical protein